MNRENYLQLFQQALNTMHEITVRKNSDYATWDDPFRNFRMVENMWICTSEEWILVRMSDKMSRISNLIKDNNPKVKDESIEDTLIDLANYSIILSIYLKHEREKNI